MSNLSILERNIIDSFGAYDDPDAVEAQFLSCLDRCGPLLAERIANEFGAIADRLSPMLDAAIRPYADKSGYGHAHDTAISDRAKQEVAAFLQERHLNYRAGGNLKLRTPAKESAA